MVSQCEIGSATDGIRMQLFEALPGRNLIAAAGRLAASRGSSCSCDSWGKEVRRLVQRPRSWGLRLRSRVWRLGRGDCDVVMEVRRRLSLRSSTSSWGNIFRLFQSKSLNALLLKLRVFSDDTSSQSWLYVNFSKLFSDKSKFSSVFK